MKKPKYYKSGPAPIYIRITVGGKRAELSTGRDCEPSRWNTQAGRANGTKEDVRTLNAYLNELQMKLHEVHRQLIEEDAVISADAIRNKFSGKGEMTRNLIEIFHDHNKKVETLIDSEYSEGTFKRYETSLKHTQNFLKWKFGFDDIDIRKIDHAFIMDYEFYLRSVRKCNNNCRKIHEKFWKGNQDLFS